MRVERVGDELHVTLTINTAKLQDYNPTHQELKKIAALGPEELHELRRHLLAFFAGERVKPKSSEPRNQDPGCGKCENQWVEQADGTVRECDCKWEKPELRRVK